MNFPKGMDDFHYYLIMMKSEEMRGLQMNVFFFTSGKNSKFNQTIQFVIEHTLLCTNSVSRFSQY